MSREPLNSRLARNLAIAGTALALWFALVLLFAAPLALTSSLSWRDTVRFGASFWALWLILLPAVAWLSFRFPIQRKALIRNIALHVLACLLMAAVNRASFRVADKVLPRASRPGAPGPPAAFGVLLGFRSALDVLVYWSLLGACQAIMNFRRSQERERRTAELEARLTAAKLQALRMQINPHFLFNTLNSIAALVYTDPRGADEMLGDLSQLLRRSLDSMEEQEITLQRELEFVSAYLSIEQRRFGERLAVEQKIPGELQTALVPAFILQPLVENAIRHGIETQREPGLITIEAMPDGQHLRLLVRDDGPGLAMREEKSGRQGVGLANIQARLQALYGSDHTFSLSEAQPHGCQVQVRMPLRTIGGKRTTGDHP